MDGRTTQASQGATHIFEHLGGGCAGACFKSSKFFTLAGLQLSICMMGVGLECSITEVQCEGSDSMKERSGSPEGGRAGLLVL